LASPSTALKKINDKISARIALPKNMIPEITSGCNMAEEAWLPWAASRAARVGSMARVKSTMLLIALFAVWAA